MAGLVWIMRKHKKMLPQVIGMSFLLLLMASGITGCFPQRNNEPSSEDVGGLEIISGSKTDKIQDIQDNDNIADNQDASTEGTTETNTGTQTGSGESYPLIVGSMNLVLTLPEGAEDVYASDSIVKYTYKNITIEYQDSFREVTQDALAILQERYEFAIDLGIQEPHGLAISGMSGRPTLNSSACVTPTATQVGSRNAYYFKLVDTFPSGDSVDYVFYVDIGADNYLEVVIEGMSTDFTEQDAFVIADLGI